MYDPVTKADHLAERGHEIVWQDAFFIEHDKSIIAILRCPVAFISRNMMGDIQTTFNGNLQQMLGALDFGKILDELFSGVSGQNNQLSLVISQVI
jgi:hypothetical protein